jgi:lipid A 3-O-deacylase
MGVPKQVYRLAKSAALAIAAVLSASSLAHAQVATLTAGSGADAQSLGVHISSNDPFWGKKFSDRWQGTLQVEAYIGNVDGKGSGGTSSVIVGASPIFRLTMVDSPLYAELGIGVNYFGNKRINASKEMGAHFQFGDMLGVGVRLADDQAHLGYRFIHYSNAGISSSNPGLDLHMIPLKVSF